MKSNNNLKYPFNFIKKHRNVLSQNPSNMLFMIFIGFSIVAIFLGVETWISREKELECAEKYFRAYTQLLSAYVRTPIEKADILLKNIQLEYPLWVSKQLSFKDINLRLEKLLDEMPFAQSLYIVDSNGKFLYDADGWLSQENIAKTPYFKEAITTDFDRLIISEPIKPKKDDAWSIALSRRLFLPNGQNAGLVQIRMPKSAFENFFVGMFIWSDSDSYIAISGTDTRLLYRYPPLPEQTGKTFSKSIMYELLQQGQNFGTYRRKSFRDGVERLFVFNRVDEYPLVVQAGVSVDYLLREWRRKALMSSAFHALLATLIIFLILSMSRNYRLALHASRYHEHYDEITGLPNIKTLKDEFSRWTNVPNQKTKKSIPIFYLEIKNFRIIVESIGGSASNTFIKIMAKRFSSLIAMPDMFARYTDSDYVFLLPNKDCNPQTLTSYADTILHLLSIPVTLSGHDLVANGSIGIAIYPDNDASFDNLIKYAQAAASHVSDQHTSFYQFYSESMNERMVNRLWMETALRKAITHEEFVLYYQPQYDIIEKKLIGFEALIRWNHPEKGMMPPDQFINVAEETGLIIPIGEWVIKTACHQHKMWLESNPDFPDVQMAVNLSAIQFMECARSRIIEYALSESGLPAHLLELEITETAAMDDNPLILKLLGRIQTIGVKIALDDFGTGYSSFSYLRRFPINKIKIDRSFVRDIVFDNDSASIVETIIAMAKALRLYSLAEGVETEEQLQCLASLGCDAVQGFIYGRPAPIEDILLIIHNKKGYQN